jgi:hypothetical protein
MDMTEHEQDAADGEMVAAYPIADPLRAAFAQALGALMRALPPSRARDIAVEQVMGAHQRTEELLARHRILN